MATDPNERVSTSQLDGLIDGVHEWLQSIAPDGQVNPLFDQVGQALADLGRAGGSARSELLDTYTRECLACSKCMDAKTMRTHCPDDLDDEFSLSNLRIKAGSSLCRLHRWLKQFVALQFQLKNKVDRKNLSTVFAFARTLPPDDPAQQRRPFFKGWKIGSDGLDERVCDHMIGALYAEIESVQRRTAHRATVLRAFRPLRRDARAKPTLQPAIDDLNQLLCQHERWAHYSSRHVVNQLECPSCLDSFDAGEHAQAMDDQMTPSVRPNAVSPDSGANPAAVAAEVEVEVVDANADEDVRAHDDAVEDQLIDHLPEDLESEILAQLAKRSDLYRSWMRKSRCAPPLEQGGVPLHLNNRAVMLSCKCKAIVHAHCWQAQMNSMWTARQRQTGLDDDAPLLCPTCKCPIQIAKKMGPLVLSSGALRGDSADRLPCAHIACQSVHHQRAERYERTSRLDHLLQVIREKPPLDQIVVFSKFPTALHFVLLMLHTAKVTAVMLEPDARGLLQLNSPDARNARVLLVPLVAGNAGLNMQAAAHCIFLDPAPTELVHAQAVARLIRMGQRKAVMVTQLLARGAEHEEKLYLASDSLHMDDAHQLRTLPVSFPHKQMDDAASAFAYWTQMVPGHNGEQASRTRAQLLEQCMSDTEKESGRGSRIVRLEIITFVQRALRADIPLAAWRKYVHLVRKAEASGSEDESAVGSTQPAVWTSLPAAELIELEEWMLRRRLGQAKQNASHIPQLSRQAAHRDMGGEYSQVLQEHQRNFDQEVMMLQHYARQLEQSKKLPMAPSTGLDLPLQPLSAPSCRFGLTNGPEQLCYLNAILQALFAVAEYDQDSALHGFLTAAAGLSGQERIACGATAELGRLYQRTRAVSPTGAGSSGLPLHQSMLSAAQTSSSSGRNHFTLSVQHDAVEFLQALDQQLVHERKYNQDAIAGAQWSQLLHGATRTHTRCASPACAKPPNQQPDQPMFVLLLDTHRSTVQQCVDSFFAQRQVDLVCQCNADLAVTHTVCTNLPPVLIVQLPRFDAHQRKSLLPIQLSTTLRVPMHDDKVREYELIAIVVRNT